MSDDLDEFIRGMRWQNENATGATLDDAEVAMVVGMADEITRLRAQVAFAYLDAADVLVEMWASTSAEHEKAIRNRTPADAAAALDTLLHQARREGAEAMREAAAKIAKAGPDIPDRSHLNQSDFDVLALEIRALNPEQVVKGGAG